MYQPSSEILKKYADVLVKFALWSGEWVKKWDVVFVFIPEPNIFTISKLQGWVDRIEIG